MNIVSKMNSISIHQIIVFCGIILVSYCLIYKQKTTESKTLEMDYSLDKNENYSVEKERIDTIIRNTQDYKFGNYQVIKFN